MALKDWKKTESSDIRTAFTKLKKIYGRKIPYPDDGQINIYKPNMSRSYWLVTIIHNNYSSPGDSHHFKTKSQALKFARKYMRTH